MGRKIKLDDKEYDVENLSDQAKSSLASLQFTIARIEELTKMQDLLTRAKCSYIDSLKKEVLSKKAGLLLSED